MWKKILTLLLAVCTTWMVIAGDMTAAAAEEAQEVQSVAAKEESGKLTATVMMTYISYICIDFEIDSAGCAAIVGNISGGSGVTKVSISVVLQKKDGTTWKTVTDWDASSKSRNLLLSKTKKLSSKGTYRVKGTFRAYKGDKCETQVKYSATKKIS